ncbi:MAG: hypothetical protein LUC86_05730 [Prevotellaceae bacterium]|nr:hypothetical protein [Prevotellaceae bacterium]MCD8285017.1 hypothetical protein [Prevotellaceae bacterium]MCD8304310.1 hypothetical protein [Prevotellaceae bacterium]
MHIGSLIRKELKDSGRTVTWFAAQICCTRTHAYKIFRSESIDTGLLERVSRVLRHDFFGDVSRSLEGQL